MDKSFFFSKLRDAQSLLMGCTGYIRSFPGVIGIHAALQSGDGKISAI